MKIRTERRTGRPREVRADRAILDATVALMGVRGVDDLRMDEVADRAGVGKATIYRRYRSKDELVTAAVAALVGEIVVPDTGSTEVDLLTLMRDAVRVYAGTSAAQAMPSLVAGMHRDPELARAIRDGFLAVRRAALAEVLKRGIERGDLSSDIELELALDVLAGPLFYRLLVTGGPIDDALAHGVVDLLLRGFAPSAGDIHRASPKVGKETSS